MNIKKFQRWFFIFFVLLPCISCSTPECIKCQNIQGYPNTTICKEAYETALTEDTPAWSEYANEAINKGCLAAE